VTNEPRTGDVEAACSEQIGMAETRYNGYVYEKLLKKKKWSMKGTEIDLVVVPKTTLRSFWCRNHGLCGSNKLLYKRCV